MLELHHTTLTLDAENPAARSDSEDDGRIMRRVAGLFGRPGQPPARLLTKASVLWRYGGPVPGCHAGTLLIQSLAPPDLSRLPKGYHHDHAATVVVEHSLEGGDLVRISLHALPVSKGVEVPYSHGGYVAWLAQQGSRHGFRVVSMTTAPGRTRVVDNVQSFTVKFAGMVQIRDVGRFQDAVIEGLGPDCEIGCGLILLRKPTS